MDTAKWLMEFLWDRFELLIRRVFFPSSVFILSTFVVDHYANSGILTKYITDIIKNHTAVLVIFSTIVVVLAVNYILKFITQFAFDNFIKVNYNPFFCNDKLGKECKQYKKLREKVVEKLGEEGIINLDDIGAKENDFILYQVLGGIMKEDTRRYVTDAKEGGVMIVSISLALSWYIYLKSVWIGIIALVILYMIGHFYIKAKFRSRAYRLYINYLLRAKCDITPIKESK